MGKKKKNKSWFARLIDMNDETVSISSLFLIVCAVISVCLLIVPIVGLCVDIYFNHTITIDLGALAEYITASCGSLICGVLQKGWTNYSSYKFKASKAIKNVAEAVENTVDDITAEAESYGDEEGYQDAEIEG